MAPSDFSESAEEVSFAIEGDGDVPVLRAVLRSEDGEQQSDLNLAERLENNNGSFVFGIDTFASLQRTFKLTDGQYRAIDGMGTSAPYW